MIVVLCGGFGAARFVEGLAQLDEELACVVNVADDFDYLGLRVCPDLDSVLYALAGCFDEVRGWGPVGDSMVANEALDRYGDGWFHLGDRDLTTSLKRTALLRDGRSLSEVAGYLAEMWGVGASILPMSNERVGTVVRTPHGWRSFQDFLVRERASLDVLEVAYEGIADTLPVPAVLAAIERAELLVDRAEQSDQQHRADPGRAGGAASDRRTATTERRRVAGRDGGRARDGGRVDAWRSCGAC